MRSVVSSCFVAFVPPSSGLTLAIIYYTLYGLCQRKPLDGQVKATTFFSAASLCRKIEEKKFDSIFEDEIRGSL